MEFWIADTFTDSLGRLTTQKQIAVKTAGFDQQTFEAASALWRIVADKSRSKAPNSAAVMS
jgi:hypothetical protein